MHTEQSLVNNGVVLGTVRETPIGCDFGGSRPVCRLLSFTYLDPAGEWRAFDGARFSEQSAQSVRMELSSSMRAEVAATVDISTGERLVTVSLRSTGTVRPGWIGLVLSARADEHFYGLGERFDSLDQRGKSVELSVVNGAQCGRTYKPIPFFLSSAGYGLSIESSARALIRFCTPDEPSTVAVRVADCDATAALYLDSTPRAILGRYTAAVGRPEVPPDWVFGPWKSRDWRTETEQTVMEDVTLGRSHHLPGTVKVIDAAWETESNSFEFDPKKFPNPREMIDRVHELGYRLIVWISPWMVKGRTPSAVYRHCAEHGYLIKSADGEPYVHRLANSPSFVGSCFDFTNADAVSWWKRQIHRLVELGVDGFKTDFGEQVPEDALFADGSSGRMLHNLYPYLYNRATYAALRELKEGILLERSAWSGCQGLSLIWAGDQTSDFAPASGLPSVIIAGQSAGLSGFPYWTCDIGGYFGQPTEEAFIRWTEFAAFCPIMQIHGLGVREPWSFSPGVLEIYRRYAQEHLDLFPLFQLLAREAHRTGLPIMRSLYLEFPDDPGVHSDAAEHEFLLGDRLLVCPVYAESDRKLFAYLPPGAWRDYWSGEPVPGGATRELAVELDEIAVFARAGALIPRLDGSPETVLPARDPTVRVATADLRLDVFGGADGSLELVDGTHFQWFDAKLELTVHNAELPRSLSLRVAGLSARRVVVTERRTGAERRAPAAAAGRSRGQRAEAPAVELLDLAQGRAQLRLEAGEECRVQFSID